MVMARNRVLLSKMNHSSEIMNIATFEASSDFPFSWDLNKLMLHQLVSFTKTSYVDR